jgi:hypothetical protein
MTPSGGATLLRFSRLLDDLVGVAHTEGRVFRHLCRKASRPIGVFERQDLADCTKRHKGLPASRC